LFSSLIAPPIAIAIAPRSPRRDRDRDRDRAGGSRRDRPVRPRWSAHRREQLGSGLFGGRAHRRVPLRQRPAPRLRSLSSPDSAAPGGGRKNSY